MFFGMLSNNFGTYISQVHLIELKKKEKKKVTNDWKSSLGAGVWVAAGQLVYH
jgi:hypothetical protein